MALTIAQTGIRSYGGARHKNAARPIERAACISQVSRSATSVYG